jgi:hypothetical protein
MKQPGFSNPAVVSASPSCSRSPPPVSSRATQRIALFVIEGSYLETSRYSDSLARDGLEITLVRERRPIQDYVDALADAGHLVERLRETDVPDAGIVWAATPALAAHSALPARSSGETAMSCRLRGRLIVVDM